MFIKNCMEVFALGEDEGLTLKNGKIVNYKSGYQVATEGKETKSALEAIKLINEYNGNCGIWFHKGTYYVDKCSRISTKREALRVGRNCNQQSIYGWKKGELIWC